MTAYYDNSTGNPKNPTSPPCTGELGRANHGRDVPHVSQREVTDADNHEHGSLLVG
jgi:hypothetical protein